MPLKSFFLGKESHPKRDEGLNLRNEVINKREIVVLSVHSERNDRVNIEIQFPSNKLIDFSC